MAGAEPGRVHPQRRQRGAQPVREVRRHHPFGRDQPGQPLGHDVEGVPRRQQLGRPGGLAARGQIAVAEGGRRVGQGAGGPGDLVASRSATRTDTPIRATATAAITAHDAATPLETSEAGR